MRQKKHRDRNDLVSSGARAAHLATRPPDTSIDEIVAAVPDETRAAMTDTVSVKPSRGKNRRQNDVNRTEYRDPRYHRGWPTIHRPQLARLRI
jgi:hypothetical protein